MGFISLKKVDGMYDKASRISSELLLLFKEHKIHKILIEENLQAFRPGFSSAKTLMTLARFNGVISYICYDKFNIKPDYINVNVARKSVGLKLDRKSEKTTKEQVLEWVSSKVPEHSWSTRVIKSGPRKGVTVINEGCFDSADAYVIASAYVQMNM
tara:strand:- start:168 stop:635 length:468 start_codon:yes stop_codon:yes gene_type:complete